VNSRNVHLLSKVKVIDAERLSGCIQIKWKVILVSVDLIRLILVEALLGLNLVMGLFI
jgi:hypothetical protein